MRSRLIHVFGGILPIILSVFTSPLTARSLGPGNRGLLVAVLAFGTIISAISNFGLPWAARASFERDFSAPSLLKRQAFFLGLKLLPFSILASLIVLSGDFKFGIEFGISIAYVVIMTFSAYTGVCANHLLVYKKTASLGVVAFTSSSIAFISIVVFYLNDELSLVSILAINCSLQLANTMLLAVLSKRLHSGQKVISKSSSQNLSIRLNLSDRRFAWLASTMDIFFSRFDVIFLSAIASNYFLGLYSIPAILVGICYTLFSTLGSAGFNSTIIGNAFTKLKIAIQLNLMLSLIIFITSAFLLLVALRPVFGVAYSESIHLLPICLAFSIFLSITVPYIQFLLINRSSLLPALVISVTASTLALLTLKLTGNVFLTASLLGWLLAVSFLTLISRLQPGIYSIASKKQFTDFLKAG